MDPHGLFSLMDLPVRVRPGRRTAQDGHGDNRGGEHPAHESASLKNGGLLSIGVSNALKSGCRVAPQMV
jgi:hypothetical protein